MTDDHYMNVPTEEGYTTMLIPKELDPILALRDTYDEDIYVVLSRFLSRNGYVVHTYCATTGILGNGHYFVMEELASAMRDTIDRAHKGVQMLRRWHRGESRSREDDGEAKAEREGERYVEMWEKNYNATHRYDWI